MKQRRAGDCNIATKNNSRTSEHYTHCTTLSIQTLDPERQKLGIYSHSAYNAGRHPPKLHNTVVDESVEEGTPLPAHCQLKQPTRRREAKGCSCKRRLRGSQSGYGYYAMPAPQTPSSSQNDRKLFQNCSVEAGHLPPRSGHEAGMRGHFARFREERSGINTANHGSPGSLQGVSKGGVKTHINSYFWGPGLPGPLPCPPPRVAARSHVIRLRFR